MLGRPDLAPGYGAVMVSSDGTSSPVQQIGGTMFSGNVNSSIGGDVAVGQLSLGMMVAGILVLGAFYLWTRGSQK
jgi:hypothetical protein